MDHIGHNKTRQSENNSICGHLYSKQCNEDLDSHLIVIICLKYLPYHLLLSLYHYLISFTVQMQFHPFSAHTELYILLRCSFREPFGAELFGVLFSQSVQI